MSAPAGAEATAARWWRCGFGGVLGALVLFGASVTPSLLPRSWLFQGLVSGVLAATGYGIGVLLGTVVRRLIPWRPGPTLRRRAWGTLLVLGALFVAASVYDGSVWQGEVHRLVEVPPPSRILFVLVLPLALLVAAALVGAVRLLRRATRLVARMLGRWIPARLATAVGVVLVGWLTLTFINDVVLETSLEVADEAFGALNGETSTGMLPPVAAERSGGPQSHVSWVSLGRKGRDFVAGGPTVGQISAFNGEPAMAPIRVYTGLDSAADAEARAALAVRELDRTRAFSRAVLVVTTTTGTGWVDENGVSPLEYMYGGDTAIVSTQYSYLPSWLSFLVDGERARVAGRELFDQVHARWAELPADARPLLLVFGESMGSFGGEAAFSDAAELRARSDGVLWVGPPNSNALWSAFTAGRQDGTREVLPVYERGQTVRFAAGMADLQGVQSSWARPRVVYLQHASDPITWWSPGLLFARPDWLEEERGRDVEPDVRWWPFVTFWQIAADMIHSTAAPPGHGHNYGTSPVHAWAAIAPAPGWSAANTDRLQALLERQSEDPQG